jgi:hypothetical protein
MNKRTDDSARSRANDQEPHRVRLPGFVSEEHIGLGDAITRAASYFGARSCGGCEGRRVALNRWMTFGSGRRKVNT